MGRRQRDEPLELQFYYADPARELSARDDDGDPVPCLLCNAPTPTPARIGYIRMGECNADVIALVVCRSCVEETSDLRAAVFEALGEDDAPARSVRA
jgi:hypothetical protein